MSFADELNSKVNDFNAKAADVLTENEFIAIKTKQYTLQIKQLCTAQANQGKKSLRGFFVPETIDHNYETTTDGPCILDEPKSLIDKKPSKNSLYGGIYGGNLSLIPASIYLFDGKDYGKPAHFKVDGAMIEKVRAGVLSNLAGEGFTKLVIEHLTGPRYGLQKLLFNEIVTTVGANHYFYVDIAW